MKTIISKDYAEMSKRAADVVASLMESRKEPLICTASGDSPAGLYRELVERVKQEKLSAENWWVVSLDEWIGMDGSDEGSCRFHLDRQLFGPAAIAESRICFFDGKTADADTECTRIEEFIQLHGGIDVAILGVGMNGHVGMNEPGVDPALEAHVAELHPTTKEVGQKYFQKQQELTGGLTLGIATLMKARHVIIVISGKHKAAIAARIIDEPTSTTLPATLLKNHPSLQIFLDHDAASALVH
ncbi:MAG TPA: glucosamine-6-phosphate deaminase [Chitinophagaceae bacterium]|jgi:galactosamine-6-phosphate isomerase